ncbi:MAG: hypothetical protein ACYDGM_08960 [Vulcanimicrobiaceae bacterium]
MSLAAYGYVASIASRETPSTIWCGVIALAGARDSRSTSPAWTTMVNSPRIMMRGGEQPWNEMDGPNAAVMIRATDLTEWIASRQPIREKK